MVPARARKYLHYEFRASIKKNILIYLKSELYTISCLRVNKYNNNFIGHCGVFCGLKWRIQRAALSQ